MYLNFNETELEVIKKDIKDYEDKVFMSRTITERERLAVREIPFILNNEQTNAMEQRQRREENDRIDFNRDLQLQAIQNSRTLYSTLPDQIPLPVNLNLINNEFDLNKIKNLNRDQLLILARKWTSDNQEQESQFISLPKTWGKNKFKIRAKLPDLFKYKIEPLIEMLKIFILIILEYFKIIFRNCLNYLKQHLF